MGAVFAVVPCLPPSVQSKTGNIFLLTLYKASDLQHVPLHEVFSSAVSELQFLENEGINIDIESGMINVRFLLAGVIGVNLAVHTILGFMRGFNANFPYRFCLTPSQDLNVTFKESEIFMRTTENYELDLAKKNPKETGVSGPSVLRNLPSVSTIDLLTIDPMHDMMEGIYCYDLGLILNTFIVKEKFFTCDELIARIDSCYYGKDEIRNKPPHITINQVKAKYIKMSASESLCFLRNIGLLIGDYIPVENVHWKLVILLKEILDVVSSRIVTVKLSYFLESLITEYLTLLIELYPTEFETQTP